MASRTPSYGPSEVERLRGTDNTDYREPFARDYDRLIYTTEFRKLQGKTQVVTAGEADFFRTRLTHTIEVAQVARRLAEALNAKLSRLGEDELTALGWPAGTTVSPALCEAAAVLHDLGHPPFAHAGEAALRKSVRRRAEAWNVGESGSFEGNAQSFRLATAVLSHHGEGRGLQLTRATLDAALKYPWVAGDPDAPRAGKWSVYPSEGSDLEWVRSDAPSDPYRPSLESQLMDWADDLAYSVHDVEDWYRAGFMPLPRLATHEPEQERFVEFVVTKWIENGAWTGTADSLSSRIRSDVLGPDLTPMSPFLVAELEGDRIDSPDSGAARRAVRRMRSLVFDDALSTVRIAPRQNVEPDVPRRHRFDFEVEQRTRFVVRVMKELLWFYVIPDARIATMQVGQQRLLTDVFDQHADAVERDELRLFPGELAEVLRTRDDQLEKLRVLTDYVANLTDAGATRLADRLRTGGARLHDYL